MAVQKPTGYAFNRTRNVYLATQLRLAATFWSRFRGLMCADPGEFQSGDGLWIVPCQGVHTLAMRFAIDVVYLNGKHEIVHVTRNLKPWRFAAVRIGARSVLELPANSVTSTGSAIGDEIELRMGRAEAHR